MQQTNCYKFKHYGDMVPEHPSFAIGIVITSKVIKCWKDILHQLE